MTVSPVHVRNLRVDFKKKRRKGNKEEEEEEMNSPKQHPENWHEFEFGYTESTRDPEPIPDGG